MRKTEPGTTKPPTDLDFFFAAAGEVEIEAGFDLDRDRFLPLELVVELGIPDLISDCVSLQRSYSNSEAVETPKHQAIVSPV